ncbi:MAG: hypothetical protein EOO47_08085 [Flavobacterium sp.]|nr:MAG: hypothetical protein EOO47_08085 [Flavobacterium sp.]
MLLVLVDVSAYAQRYSFEFYNDTFNIEIDSSIVIPKKPELSSSYISNTYQKLNAGKYQTLVNTLVEYQQKKQLNDWLFYQLVRKTAEAISPKKENYERYTLYKWFLMTKAGYDIVLSVADNRIVMYAYNNENISDIPFINIGKKKYMCLNFHDYDNSNFTSIPDSEIISSSTSTKSFSYRVNRMPDFNPKNYNEKRIAFRYKMKDYHFDVKINNDIDSIFKNYPGVDFSYYFNIPLTNETYGSLIPILKKNVAGMNEKRGVDYLMRFTRYAFLYENDNENFGKEKRLSPEQTILNRYSDCDDRAALFFYLVKEIYNLPMIVVAYPTHVTMAVQFDKPIGNFISYNNKSYTVCEPTPQSKDLRMGQLPQNLKKTHYEIVYAYEPK